MKKLLTGLIFSILALTSAILYVNTASKAEATYYSQALGSAIKNRVINGRFVIDQRNNGAAVTVNSTAQTFGPDRWFGAGQTASTPGVFTLTRSASTPPEGESTFLRVETTTADASIDANATYNIFHRVEGYNWTDMGWGATGAKQVTLSFKVRTSISGTQTWSGFFANNAPDRCYLFQFQTTAANTWQDIALTVPGDITGTWNTTNQIGVQFSVSLTTGASQVGTPGSWSGTFKYGVSGQTQLLSTLNATLDFSKVQLEAGVIATPFEFRLFSQELLMCQRYCHQIGVAGSSVYIGAVRVESATQAYILIPLPCVMRTAPTPSTLDTASLGVYDGVSNNGQLNTNFYIDGGPHGMIYCTGFSALTANRIGYGYVNSNKWLRFDAEL